MSAPLRAKKKNNTIVWALLGLLVISLTGFGVRSVGHGGSQAIGTVGDEKVTVDVYVRALNTQLRAISQQAGINISLQQGLTFGVDQQVLAQVLGTAAIDGENSRIGLSLGDQRVKDNLLATEAFQSLSGKFDKAAYDFALERANLSPGEYDETIRNDAARVLLQASVTSGIRANDTYGLALLNFLGETRDFRWARVDETMLSEATRAPTPAEIDAHYRANPEAYTAPEIRKISYILLTPEMLIPSIEVSEEALQTAYDSQSDRFNQPARVIVDRLVFGSDAEAQEALDKITAGTKIFGDIVATRGLELEDIDMGEVTKSDLSAQAAEAVFLLTEPGLVGPIQSSLGPALFRVNAVLAAQNTSFENARSVLHAEFVADRARRMVDDNITNIDDLLAGGATLEEIADETPMELTALDFSSGDEDGIAAYENFRNAALAVAEKDFAEVLSLSDGGIFALRLDGIVPPTVIPLADVADRVTSDWTAAENRKRVLELAAELQTRLEGGETFEELALLARDEAKISRDAFVETAPAGLVADMFGQSVNGIAVVEGRDVIVLAKLSEITSFDGASANNVEVLASVAQQYSGQIGTDVFAAFTAAIQDDAGVTLNQALINAVHAQIP